MNKEDKRDSAQMIGISALVLLPLLIHFTKVALDWSLVSSISGSLAYIGLGILSLPIARMFVPLFTGSAGSEPPGPFLWFVFVTWPISLPVTITVCIVTAIVRAVI